MEMDSDNEEDGFVEACFENAHFQDMFERYSGVKAFLERDEKIFARSSTAMDADQDSFLIYSTDVDGCVVELKSLRGINLHVRHLRLMPNGLFALRKIFSMLKKHLDLSQYSKPQLANLKLSFGTQLFYEQGWECWIGMVPCTTRNGKEVESDVLKNQSFSFLVAVRTLFAKKLLELSSSCEAIPKTLMKNNLLDIGTLYVLPDDSGQILSILQESIDNCSVHRDFLPIIFCFRFGEKSTNGVCLKDFIPNEIQRVTVHSAVDISSPMMELLWSMDGLQSVIGSRGTLSTCASFSDCGNFQSNLDGNLLDVSKHVRTVCFEPDKLRFVQFYADLPHLKPKTRFHPVSGCIAGGMVFPSKTEEAFKKDAKAYISTIETNFMLLKTSTCRLEFVTELTEIKDVIKATDCIDVNKLNDLLEKKPLLVPFPCGTMACTRKVGLWCTEELKRLLTQYGSTGNVASTWQAFQLEMAIEKVLWGFPLCFKSKQYSVNLGPGKLEPSRSKTDYYGFLALENPTACMVHEDCLPICSIWTSSQVVSGKMSRSAGIHDILGSSSYAVGRRLVDVLIGDLCEIGRTGMRCEEFKQELFSDKPRLAVTGCVTIRQLIRLLVGDGKRLPVAMAYGSVCGLLKKSGTNLEVVLKDGLCSGIRHFPAIRSHDIHRNRTIDWTIGMGVWKVIDLAENTSQVQSISVLSKLVTSELEMRRIVYVSKLKKAPGILPWLDECCKKLTGQKLSEEDSLKILCFISCIALMMNGWYVEYDGLQKLMTEITVDQYRLRDLEILSKLQLAHFNKFKLFRLHHSVPFRIMDVDLKGSNKRNTDVELNQKSVTPVIETVPNRITEDYEPEGLENTEIIFRVPTCLPSTRLVSAKWKPKELELLHDVWSKRNPCAATPKSLYNSFKQKCIENDIPFRTFRAFENKLNRMRDSSLKNM